MSLSLVQWKYLKLLLGPGICLPHGQGSRNLEAFGIQLVILLSHLAGIVIHDVVSYISTSSPVDHNNIVRNNGFFLTFEQCTSLDEPRDWAFAFRGGLVEMGITPIDQCQMNKQVSPLKVPLGT